MVYAIKLILDAHKDFKSAQNWYASISEELGNRFRQSVQEKVNLIAQNPYQFQKRHKELRMALVKRFPYAIYFITGTDQKRIVILAILHTKRNPKIPTSR
ncbi:type II toxin-antitoxin system RelE/ParE family toxin [Flagellimonas algicola]|uniref:Type II toxin-antitoxin system RelE/ParE family toxin n=1 Tax=Flagellimonas algicola TaxID=2583815 RepID=A0ABY2WNW3_9FLAO|nr:type II toxin-antitoxin system RelE/ParE family toxin [Allomuricauda algicola]TMU56684.1 type II toxin-antitoxin system RelE/ParE family toxin [Allomuricauda algicola]